MAKNIKGHLEDIFEDLGEEGQKKFKSKLLDRKAEPRVRRAAVEKLKDYLDLASLMVTTFTETGAVPVTLEILKAAGYHEQVKELIQNTGQSASLVPSPGPSAPSNEHFIDRNWKALVDRVHNVNPILDDLLDMKVITDEVYSNIRAERIPQNKMRELIRGPIKSAGTKGKDALYKSLKDNETCLVEELEGQ